ncbi:hypothetical protein EYF80_031224 [Liparis tanakae]|uniref:Uncharacterized protein n=1 Tax=Liparis tanakae TaxID=230148 RepID=A0A4Z2H197_9TELE|nr:hypothetical protein EYF80_031224 [Liparis tanakae]
MVALVRRSPAREPGRFSSSWIRIMGGGWEGCPGDCVWGGITGEAAGGTEGGAGEGLPVSLLSHQRCSLFKAGARI